MAVVTHKGAFGTARDDFAIGVPQRATLGIQGKPANFAGSLSKWDLAAQKLCGLKDFWRCRNVKPGVAIAKRLISKEILRGQGLPLTAPWHMPCFL